MLYYFTITVTWIIAPVNNFILDRLCLVFIVTPHNFPWIYTLFFFFEKWLCWEVLQPYRWTDRKSHVWNMRRTIFILNLASSEFTLTLVKVSLSLSLSSSLYHSLSVYLCVCVCFCSHTDLLSDFTLGRSIWSTHVIPQRERERTYPTSCVTWL